ncbi:type III effector protein [Kitasatospora sp. NPDC101801]|uniref:type III effector protein n=1 Tax=Kitasatospora sp. NPDC101801 TaxID=3364103 RepID=UPI00382361D7
MNPSPGTPPPSDSAPAAPASFPAAAAALTAIDDAVRAAQSPEPKGRTPSAGGSGPGQALDALQLLRELRTQLAGWEAGLVENARDAGATWADLAQPMGVASRQAAETRYLRLRPAGTRRTPATGVERVKAVRDRRAAERTVTAWARDNAADLRILAAQIAALTDLAPAARPGLAALRTALASTDPAELIGPLAAMRSHLEAGHPDLGTRLDALNQHTDQLRDDSNHRRT